MSVKSFNVTFSQSFKMTMSEETIAEVREGLQKSVALSDAHPEQLNAEQRAFLPVLKAHLAKEDDEFLPWFIRVVMRQGIRDEFVKSLDDLWATKFAPSKVEVTPRGN